MSEALTGVTVVPGQVLLLHFWSETRSSDTADNITSVVGVKMRRSNRDDVLLDRKASGFLG